MAEIKRMQQASNIQDVEKYEQFVSGFSLNIRKYIETNKDNEELGDNDDQIRFR